MPEKIIIADSSTLIALEDINELDILKILYKEIVITDYVKNEIQVDLPDWILVSKEYDQNNFKLLTLQVDVGEASALALALKKQNSTLIIDEKKGRALAKKMGIKIIGLLGIIIKAKEEGIIESGMPLLTKLEQHGFWISESLKEQIKKKLNE